MAPETSEGLPLLRALTAALRHRRLLLGLTFAVAFAVGVYTFFQPRTYSSSATFMPQAPAGKLSQFSGLAAQFGVTVPGAEPGSSPAFYGALVQSREVLRAAVRTVYPVRIDGVERKVTLVEWYDPPGETPAAREEAAMLSLQRAMRVTTDVETGTVAVRVRTRSPGLSHQVTSRVMALVGEFNLQRRQSQAGAERRFVEGRVKDAKERLNAAEDRLQQFMQRNRDFRSSPQLMFESERLAREVTAQSQLYSVLTQSYEQARIDEVRNTPVITLVDPPHLPARPDPRWLVVKVLLGALAGLFIGLFVALWREFMSRSEEAPDATVEEFRRLREEAFLGLRQTAGRLTRAVRSPK
jgi:uncharacterized protein involved in exopolysaccharide biosynthesis